jgi:hypothetical protein
LTSFRLARIIARTMRKKSMKSTPGMAKGTTVRTTMKAPFGGRMMKARSAKRGGRGR